MARPQSKARPLPPDGYVLGLERDNENLRRRVEDLEAQLAAAAPVKIASSAPSAQFGLTNAESRILGHLVASPFSTRQQLLDAVTREGRKVPGIKIVEVYINRIRNKLLPFGIVIESRYGIGYRIDPDSRTVLAGFQEEAT